MFAKTRLFFSHLGVTEVDCPLLSKAASIDAHIDLIPSQYLGVETRYLHSSPEYGMKRLLAEGIGDIYQLSHVFRDGELGSKHNPEFMMTEWYRIGFSLEKMIGETLDYIRLFVGNVPKRVLSYQEAFIQYAEIDPFATSEEKLRNYLRKRKEFSQVDLDLEDFDGLLNYILAFSIEPLLGQNELIALAYYPSSQAALAQTRILNGVKVAERFEVYYKGVELANGYHELANYDEQLKRLMEANQTRAKLGKTTLPIDYNFLKALQKGLPECCGVAVGFDRLMMLYLNKDQIADVIPMGWMDA